MPSNNKYNEAQLNTAINSNSVDATRLTPAMSALLVEKMNERAEEMSKLRFENEQQAARLALLEKNWPEMFSFRESKDTDSMTGGFRAKSKEELDAQIDGFAAMLKAGGSYTDGSGVVWFTSARMMLGKPVIDGKRENKHIQSVKLMPNTDNRKVVDTSATAQDEMPD